MNVIVETYSGERDWFDYLSITVNILVALGTLGACGVALGFFDEKIIRRKIKFSNYDLILESLVEFKVDNFLKNGDLEFQDIYFKFDDHNLYLKIRSRENKLGKICTPILNANCNVKLEADICKEGTYRDKMISLENFFRFTDLKIKEEAPKLTIETNIGVWELKPSKITKKIWKDYFKKFNGIADSGAKE